MSKYVMAYDIEVLDSDDEGATIKCKFDCPYCNETNYKLLFFSDPEAGNLNFDTDQKCDNCGDTVTVGCPA